MNHATGVPQSGGAPQMRELSLFTGAGGGVLGSLLLGWHTVGYVEYEDYCQRILKQRMDDGILCQAPIFGDIRAFISEGYAASYQGMVDVITAGFPCQPFSVAGKQLGADDPRNMWPATIDTIRIVRPRFALLENVPGLLGSGYFGRILGDLAESGYDARWRMLSAAEVGAPHLRDRLWIVCNAKRNGRIRRAESPDFAKKAKRRIKTKWCEDRKMLEVGTNCNISVSRTWWGTFGPSVPFVAHGMADRMDRLRASGNGQVPIVAATAWKLLTESS